jgi:ribonuclease HI
MRREILGEFAGKDIVVGGDGQCDSPGFNAKNLCYFFVEVDTNYIIDVEILDKRHVGLTATNMEREGVKRGLENLNADHVKVVELITDASTSVKGLLG